MARADPQLPGAGLRSIRAQASGVSSAVAPGQDVVGAEDRDRVLDRDVEVIDRDREARCKARLEHDAVGVRIRILRCQLGIAALQEVVLTCRAVQRRAPSLPPARRSPGSCRESRCSSALTRVVVAGSACSAPAARIARRIEQVEALCREQLDDVGRTDRLLVAGTQADVRNRRPLEAKLVSVGLHAVTVVRVTVGGVEGQALRERLVLSDRDPGFHEEFLDRRGAADADRRATRAAQRARFLQRVDGVAERVAPILGAEHQLDAVGGPRRLDAVGAEVAVDDAVVDLLVDAADLQARGLQVGELVLGHAARDERIPGHAVRIRAVDDRLAGRHAADVVHVERTRHTRCDVSS